MLPSKTASSSAASLLSVLVMGIIAPPKKFRWFMPASRTGSRSNGTPTSVGSSSAHSGR